MTSRGAVGPATPRRQVLLGLAVLLQLAVLYSPRAPSTGGVPGLDKVVHATIFGLVAWAAFACGARWLTVALLLVAHAVVSELAQHWLLPNRSGDPFDVVADVVGVLLALALGSRVAARRRRRRLVEAVLSA